MSALAPIPTLQPADSLEQMLAGMRKYGMPRLGVFGPNGWHCNIEMFVSATGAQFKVASEFNHPSATEAVRVCIDRMHESLRKIGVAQ
jgi:hypothetical protein